MVSRRTERDYTPHFTKAGTGKLFFEPAAGPQQQKQDINNKREQGFKTQLMGSLDLTNDAGRTPGEMLVNSAFASRDSIINDTTGSVQSSWNAKGGLSGPPTLTPKGSRDLAERSWSDDSHVDLPTRFEDPSDKNIDRYEFQTPGMRGGTTLPGSIAALPQRSMERHYEDKTRAEMPGEARANSPYQRLISGGRTETTWRRGGQNAPFGFSRASHGSQPIGWQGEKQAEERAGMQEASTPGEGLGVGWTSADDETLGTDLTKQADAAAKSVVVSRMAKSLARDTTVEPDDLAGLGSLHTRSGGNNAPGWYRGGRGVARAEMSVGDPVGNTPTLVHEIGHHVSTKSEGYHQRVERPVAVARNLSAPKNLTQQHPREEAFADDYRAANLPSHEGTGYRYSDAYFSSPDFASEYDHARAVPDRGDAASVGRNNAARALNLTNRIAPDEPSTRRVGMVAEDVKRRLGPEPRKPGQPTLFDRSGEPFPERL